MAKLKSKIASKYSTKPKRKLVLGGPEQELYLNDNVTYQAQDAPTMMLQNQFDANEQAKAKRMTAIYGDQMARQLNYLQDQTAAVEQRKEEEKVQQQATAAANTQQIKNTANKNIGTALTTGIQAAKTGYQIQQSTNAAMAAAKPVSYTSNIGSWVGSGPSSPVVQSAAKTGLQAGAKAVGGAALVALPQIAGQVAYNQLHKADDRQMEREGRSQYYDDTEYSRKEYNAQLAKSAGKGATIGGTIGSAIPGVGTGIGMAVGTIIGTGAGLIKAQHQRRMTKSEDERGVKLGNKRIGKKLLFGEENVYDENLDPTVIEKRNREAQLKAMTDTATAMDNARMGSMMQSDVNTGFGLKNSTFEAKYGGNIKYLKGGVAKSIGRGAIEYVGKKHEYGGIDLPGNIEVEGGETEQNDYIFSATLKLPNGATYAQAHKNLIKSGATGEEIHQLALSQEAAAGRNPNQIKGMKFAKYGGPLQYDKGGKKDPDKDKPKNNFEPGSKEFLEAEGFIISENSNPFKNTENGYIEYNPKTKKYTYNSVTSKEGVGGANAVRFDNFNDFDKVQKKTDKLTNKFIEKDIKVNNKFKEGKISKDRELTKSVNLIDRENRQEARLRRRFTTNEETPTVNQNTNQVVDDGRLAVPRPITEDEYQFYLREKAAKEANEAKKSETTTTTNVDASAYKPPVTTQSPNTVTTNPPVTTNTTTTNPPAVTTNTTVTNPPVTTQTNNPPVTTTNTNMPTTDNNQPTANPTYNTYNMPYQYTATNKGALDYSDPNVAGEIWAGDKYNTEWKPLVSGTMSDAGKADKVISYLENYNGQDAADVKAKIAGKTREEKIAIINRLATDNKVGPFHNAVLEGINTTKETPPPVKEVPKENPKDEGTPPPTIPVKNFELPPPTKYDYVPPQSNLGLIQAAPAIYPFLNRVKTKDVTPAIATGYVQPGAVGKINMGRITLNSERDDNRTAQAAMNQALQNMSGPGAVAGMLAAKTKADQQSMRIAQAEQNTNMGRAGEEAKINAGISQFNVGQAMGAQQTNAQLAQMNAARTQEANKFNRQLGFSRDVENREQELAALDRASQTVAANSIANAKIQADYGLAAVQDYSQAYRRYLDQVNKQTAKFGGVKKYVSRLGDLKNNRYKV